MRRDPGYRDFPRSFFERADGGADSLFYATPRLVHHVDVAALDALSDLYRTMRVNGRVLDLMGSWVSHFDPAPARLAVLGMNQDELDANPAADETLAHDLNRDPRLPWPADSFDDVVCALSVDYLVQPLEVFDEIARVLAPNGRFICTFSNRCFPTKALQGWLHASDSMRCEIVATYFRLSTAWQEPTVETIIRGGVSDPLFAVWATVDSSPEAAPES